ncbi:MAG: septal ring lytic transglycosylase RlpA family protein [Gammaproteobacteria bacterium]|nr:septal ring lytic transglycosylase RlpA family protein [Gammaproteobacteria bacterium]MBU2058943.1 septal ring lytic transglycosylase RlpA family protein [Gammaproteobacteria bacterium]MBU2175068.1 septal ring lytic transglycosylase RlpA family protein [Gammaproteobacteria bacterium]MBU2246751.1 septal ring lytic transglycosylase RlpA family protein [Gammaproteobacteria bacterium]MBU2345937.1 septal ring lytic transglycosylase RlpA family protein [Gammaproteobacteria bacterium]
MIKKLSALCCTLMLASCSQSPAPAQKPAQTKAASGWEEPNKGRYSQATDSHPDRLPTLLEMTDPEPRAEALSRGGNKPYTIYGVDYSPRTDLMEYKETGIASWYGHKFHGHLTSNGETYNVFSMTAAHKTLPLPSYVRVTNLDNGKSAVVRVNDRGPFHKDRVIDLSYSAAYKIGMMGKGTARVQVELLASPAMTAQESYAMGLGNKSNQFEETTIASNPAGPRPGSLASPAAVSAPVKITSPAAIPAPVAAGSKVTGCFIQLVASSNKEKLQKLGSDIQQQWSVSTQINDGNGIFRLLAGPMPSAAEANSWLERFKSADYPSAYITDKKSCG